MANAIDFEELLSRSGFSRGLAFHEKIIGCFREKGRHTEIAAQTYDELRSAPWPAGSGAYIVSMRSDESMNGILYIGKTGKLKGSSNGDISMGSGSLRGRLHRWTPYCFQKEGPFASCFEYGPNFSVNELKKQEYAERYQKRVPFSELKIECLSTSGIEKQVAPALVEGLLLANFVASLGRLPLANQEL
jgi:hypothetical protein